MTVQTVTLGRKKFVIVPEKDYRVLTAKAARSKPLRKGTRLSTQDRTDIALARQRLADPTDKEIPYEQARRQLGLA